MSNKNGEKGSKNKNQQQNKKTQPSNKNKKDEKYNKGNFKDAKNQKGNKEHIYTSKEAPIREVREKVEIQPKIDTVTTPTEENVESSTYGKYRKRKIETNWTKDELPENIYDRIEQSSHGANMQELFNKPMSVGDHFQFKSEKHWNFDNLHPNDDELFMLDFKKIGEHVTCVPFYELMELDPSFFTESQVEEMKNTAAKNKLVYESKLNQDVSIFNSKICNILKETTQEKFAEEPVHERSTIDIKKPLKEINTNFITNIEIQNIDNEPKISNQNSDDDLEDLLETVSHKFQDISVKKDDPHSNVRIANAPQIQTEDESQEDLEEWLSEYLGG